MAKRPSPLTLRLGDLEEEVLARGDRPGLTIKRDLRRFYDLLQVNVPRLTPDEAMAALRATAGKTIEPAYLTFALGAEGKVDRITLKPVSPIADFSYDYQDLMFTPAQG